MATANSSSFKSGTWLITSFLVLVTAVVLFSRLFHAPSDETQDLLRREGMPAARQGIALSQEGRKLLSSDEQREMDAIYTEALKTLPADEKQRFATLAQNATAATDNEIAESAALLQKALRALPQERKARLWELIEKAVKLAQQKAPAATRQQ